MKEYHGTHGDELKKDNVSTKEVITIIREELTHETVRVDLRILNVHELRNY
jgi:hypothetical protein